MLSDSTVTSLQDCSLNIAERQIHNWGAPKHNCNDSCQCTQNLAEHQNTTLPPTCSFDITLLGMHKYTRRNQNSIAKIAHRWALCPRFAQREVVCELAHLHTNVLTQLLDWACLYQQSSRDLLDLQSIPGDAHGCLLSLCLHHILHMVTSLLEALYFCLPCSHSQEREKNRQHSSSRFCSGISTSCAF